MATDTKRYQKHRAKGKAAGDKRLSVAISKDAVDALNEIISGGYDKTQASAITSALLVYRDQVIAKPTLLTRLTELEHKLAAHLAECHTVAVKLPPATDDHVASNLPDTDARSQKQNGNKRISNKTTADHEAIARVVLELRHEAPNRTLVNMASVILERFPTLFNDNMDAETYLASPRFSDVLAGQKIQVDGLPKTAPNEVPKPLIPKGTVDRENALLQLATTPIRE